MALLLVRLFASKLPELVVAASCSKGLGLYREPTGTASKTLHRDSYILIFPMGGNRDGRPYESYYPPN